VRLGGAVSTLLERGEEPPMARKQPLDEALAREAGLSVPAAKLAIRNRRGRLLSAVVGLAPWNIAPSLCDPDKDINDRRTGQVGCPAIASADPRPTHATDTTGQVKA
jgi:hypothetical protein